MDEYIFITICIEILIISVSLIVPHITKRKNLIVKIFVTLNAFYLLVFLSFISILLIYRITN